jgi:uncharacterized membrane protein
VIVSALLLFLIAITIETGIIQIILGLIFVLFLPGYAIVSALFPKAEGMDNIERVALSLGLSIAVVPFMGVLINYSPWSINLITMLVPLLALIISVSMVAWYRRSKTPVEDRFNVSIPFKLPKSGELATVDKGLIILLIIAMIITTSIVMYLVLVPKDEESYTGFYVLDENGTMLNFPNNLTIGESGNVIIGVFCHENKITKYTIEVELINLTGERENRTMWFYDLTLKHNQHNETIYSFNLNENGIYKLQFLLYINNDNEPYRTLYIWINVIS